MIIHLKHNNNANDKNNMCFPMSVAEKRMKLLVFILRFWLKRFRGKNNNKNGNKFNYTNTR